MYLLLLGHNAREWRNDTKTADMKKHNEETQVKSNDIATVDVGDGTKTRSCKRNKATSSNLGQNIVIPSAATHTTVGSKSYIKAVSCMSEPPENSFKSKARKLILIMYQMSHWSQGKRCNLAQVPIVQPLIT